MDDHSRDLILSEQLLARLDAIQELVRPVPEINERLGRVGARLDRVETRLDVHEGLLREHSATLREHGEMLRQHGGTAVDTGRQERVTGSAETGGSGKGCGNQRVHGGGRRGSGA